MLTKKIKKITVFLLLSALLASDSARANPFLLSAPHASEKFPEYKILLPSRLGSVQKIRPAGKNKPFIFYVQTTHGNYEGARQVARIIRFLKKNYDTDFVWAEGAAGKLDSKYLSFFKDGIKNQKLLESLGKKGFLTGPDFALSGGIEGWGIEQGRFYRPAFKAFKRVISRLPENSEFISHEKRKLDLEASKIFSESDRDLLVLWWKHEEGAHDFYILAKELKRKASELLGLDFENPFSQFDWPHLTRFILLSKLEEKRDEAVFSDEIKRLKDVFRMNQAALSFIETLSRQPKKISRDKFALFLKTISKSNVSLRDYPQIIYANAAAIFQNEISVQKLSEEIELIFERMFQASFAGPARKALAERYRKLNLLKKTLSLELSRREWDDLKNENIERPEIPEVSAALDFYRLNEKRERAFVEKIAHRAEADGLKTSVLVAGGFHSKGIEEELGKKDFGYAVIQPHLTGESGSELYHRRMMGKSNLEMPEFAESVAAGLGDRAFYQAQTKIVSSAAYEIDPWESIQSSAFFIGRNSELRSENKQIIVQFAYLGTFLDGKRISKVFLAGDFNNWAADGPGDFAMKPEKAQTGFFLRVSFLNRHIGKSYKYKFLVVLENGEKRWVLNPDSAFNPETTHEGGHENHVYTIPESADFERTFYRGENLGAFLWQWTARFGPLYTIEWPTNEPWPFDYQYRNARRFTRYLYGRKKEHDIFNLPAETYYPYLSVQEWNELFFGSGTEANQGYKVSVVVPKDKYGILTVVPIRRSVQDFAGNFSKYFQEAYPMDKIKAFYDLRKAFPAMFPGESMPRPMLAAAREFYEEPKKEGAQDLGGESLTFLAATGFQDPEIRKFLLEKLEAALNVKKGLALYREDGYSHYHGFDDEYFHPRLTERERKQYQVHEPTYILDGLNVWFRTYANPGQMLSGDEFLDISRLFARILPTDSDISFEVLAILVSHIVKKEGLYAERFREIFSRPEFVKVLRLLTLKHLNYRVRYDAGKILEALGLKDNLPDFSKWTTAAWMKFLIGFEPEPNSLGFVDIGVQLKEEQKELDSFFERTLFIPVTDYFLDLFLPLVRNWAYAGYGITKHEVLKAGVERPLIHEKYGGTSVLAPLVHQQLKDAKFTIGFMNAPYDGYDFALEAAKTSDLLIVRFHGLNEYEPRTDYRRTTNSWTLVRHLEGQEFELIGIFRDLPRDFPLTDYLKDDWRGGHAAYVFVKKVSQRGQSLQPMIDRLRGIFEAEELSIEAPDASSASSELRGFNVSSATGHLIQILKYQSSEPADAEVTRNSQNRYRQLYDSIARQLPPTVREILASAEADRHMELKRHDPLGVLSALQLYILNQPGPVSNEEAAQFEKVIELYNKTSGKGPVTLAVSFVEALNPYLPGERQEKTSERLAEAFEKLPGELKYKTILLNIFFGSLHNRSGMLSTEEYDVSSVLKHLEFALKIIREGIPENDILPERKAEIIQAYETALVHFFAGAAGIFTQGDLRSYLRRLGMGGTGIDLEKYEKWESLPKFKRIIFDNKELILGMIEKIRRRERAEGYTTMLFSWTWFRNFYRNLPVWRDADDRIVTVDDLFLHPERKEYAPFFWHFFKGGAVGIQNLTRSEELLDLLSRAVRDLENSARVSSELRIANKDKILSAFDLAEISREGINAIRKNEDAFTVAISTLGIGDVRWKSPENDAYFTFLDQLAAKEAGVWKFFPFGRWFSVKGADNPVKIVRQFQNVPAISDPEIQALADFLARSRFAEVYLQLPARNEDFGREFHWEVLRRRKESGTPGKKVNLRILTDDKEVFSVLSGENTARVLYWGAKARDFHVKLPQKRGASFFWVQDEGLPAEDFERASALLAALADFFSPRPVSGRIWTVRELLGAHMDLVRQVRQAILQSA